MRCEDVAESLAAMVEEGATVDAAARRHVQTCLRCQAELVQYRKLLRALHQLRTEVIEPTPGLVPEILAALERAGERRAIRSLVAGRRGAYVGGIAAAATAGAAAGAWVLANRARQRRLRIAS